MGSGCRCHTQQLHLQTHTHPDQRRQRKRTSSGTMASCKLCLLAALCSFLILTTLTGSTQSASCCLSYTRRSFRCKRLMNYTLQTNSGSCDITAVVFNIGNKFVCANPREAWALRGIKCVNTRKMKAQI